MLEMILNSWKSRLEVNLFYQMIKIGSFADSSIASKNSCVIRSIFILKNILFCKATPNCHALRPFKLMNNWRDNTLLLFYIAILATWFYFTMLDFPTTSILNMLCGNCHFRFSINKAVLNIKLWGFLFLNTACYSFCDEYPLGKKMQMILHFRMDVAT